MDDYIGEIRLFPYTRIPKYWAVCNGQQLSVSQNTALYALLGNKFGGNQTAFNLPNLQYRVPMGSSQGSSVGHADGAATVTLTMQNIPAHSHQLYASHETASVTQPRMNAALAVANGQNQNIYDAVAPNATVASESISNQGGSQEHSNMQPSLGLVYCICTNGMWPQRP